MGTEAVENMLLQYYRRMNAGQKGRGGETIQGVSDTEFLNAVARAVLEISAEQRAMKKKRLSFPEFCKDIIQKTDDNPLILGALILSGVALGALLRGKFAGADSQ